jgi:hypothetical protein
MHSQSLGNLTLPKYTYLNFLVAPQFLKCLLCLRASLLDSLGLFDQHVALTGLDINFGLLLIDLRFPRLQFLLFLFNLVMKYLRLVYRTSERMIK